MIRAKTMTMPTTAATVLFLWRVREASAKKSVLLWDVMVDGGESPHKRQRGTKGGTGARNERERERERRSRGRAGEPRSPVQPAARSAVPPSLVFKQLTAGRFVLA